MGRLQSVLGDYSLIYCTPFDVLMKIFLSCSLAIRVKTENQHSIYFRLYFINSHSVTWIGLISNQFLLYKQCGDSSENRHLIESAQAIIRWDVSCADQIIMSWWTGHFRGIRKEWCITSNSLLRIGPRLWVIWYNVLNMPAMYEWCGCNCCQLSAR